MTKDCLITKLKASVNNDGLVKLGKITLLNGDADTYTTFEVGTNDAASPCRIKVARGDNHLKAGGQGYDSATDLGQEVLTDFSADRLFYLTPGANAVVDIDNIVNIRYLKISSESVANQCLFVNNLDCLHTLSGLKNLFFLKYDDSAKRLVEQLQSISGFESLILNSCSINGKLQDFAPLAGLKVLQIAECNNLSGNISELGSLVNLNTLYMHGVLGYTGTLEGFVAAQRANGRTTNNVGINFVWLASTNIKFDGEFVNLGDTPTLTWTADTITLSNSQGYSKTVSA